MLSYQKAFSFRRGWHHTANKWKQHNYKAPAAQHEALFTAVWHRVCECIVLADPDNPFRKSMVFNILTREGDTASIPCLATDPSLDNLRLETCSRRALASGLQFSASLEQGIIIHNIKKSYEDCYVCTGALQGEYVRSHNYYLTVKPGKMLF